MECPTGNAAWKKWLFCSSINNVVLTNIISCPSYSHKFCVLFLAYMWRKFSDHSRSPTLLTSKAISDPLALKDWGHIGNEEPVIYGSSLLLTKHVYWERDKAPIACWDIVFVFRSAWFISCQGYYCWALPFLTWWSSSDVISGFPVNVASNVGRLSCIVFWMDLGICIFLVTGIVAHMIKN